MTGNTLFLAMLRHGSFVFRFGMGEIGTVLVLVLMKVRFIRWGGACLLYCVHRNWLQH